MEQSYYDGYYILENNIEFSYERVVGKHHIYWGGRFGDGVGYGFNGVLNGRGLYGFKAVG